MVGAFLAALFLTGRFRRYALARKLVDIPNPRSSHSVPVPRGGGVVIALTTLIALSLPAAKGALAWTTLLAVLGGGALVAFIGLADDHGQITLGWRLLSHFAAAAWVLAWLGEPPPLQLLGFVLDVGWLRYALAALYLVWLLNLTNFMDGIDGIAAVEAITVSLGGVFLYRIAAPAANEWLAPLVLAATTLGFLVWNWPPAKIFLGDSGSGFLGLMLATLSLQAALVATTLYWGWVILLGVFVVDATVTLARRVVRGERFYEAHRSHAYQHAAQRWGAHLPVTVAVGVINLCWLLPIALIVALRSLDPFLGVLIAYSPLVAAALWLRAGEPSTA
jgi:glycosyltransferase WbpL